MTRLVIGVSGGIAAGKSEFIQALVERLAGVVTGFGDFVRREAAIRGLDAQSRDVLQRLGEQLKSELGDEEFVRRVVASVGNECDVVVDGVRHVEIADAIAGIVHPRRFVLMFLDADADTRRQRAELSRPQDASRLAKLAEHSTERQVHDGSVRARADLVLDAGKPLAELVAEAIRFLDLEHRA